MLPAWLMHVVARLGTGCSTLAKCFATSSLLLPLGKMLRPSDSVGGGSEMPGTLGQPKAVAISSHPFADLKAVSSMSQLVAVIHQQHHLQQVLLAHLRWQTQQDSVKLFCCHSDSNPNPLKKGFQSICTCKNYNTKVARTVAMLIPPPDH